MLRLLLAVLILSEIFFGLILLGPVFVDRKDLARAVAEHHVDPSPETQAELTRQQALTRHERDLTELAIGLLFLGNTKGLICVFRRMRAKTLVSPKP